MSSDFGWSFTGGSTACIHEFVLLLICVYFCFVISSSFFISWPKDLFCFVLLFLIVKLLKPEASQWSIFNVAEHSFGSLWVRVICQMMVRESLQLTGWNLASEKYTDEKFWLTGKIWHFRSFHGNMNDWIQP